MKISLNFNNSGLIISLKFPKKFESGSLGGRKKYKVKKYEKNVKRKSSKARKKLSTCCAIALSSGGMFV